MKRLQTLPFPLAIQLLILVAIFSSSFSLPAWCEDAAVPLVIKPQDRLVLVGNTFVERMNARGYFESALFAAHPEVPFSFRNLGWSGDTVWGDARAVFGNRADGFKRLVKDTLEAKPTVILICYGENEAYAGSDGLEDFRIGYEQLLAALVPAKARIVLIAPRQHEQPPPPLPDQTSYNTSLTKYRDVIRNLADQKGCGYCDLGDALFDSKTSSSQAGPLTENGIHLTERGSRQLATEWVRRLTGRSLDWSLDLNATTGKTTSQGVEIKGFTKEEQDVHFMVSDATLPLPNLAVDGDASEDEMGTNAMSNDGSNERTLKVAGLAAGKYELLVAGKAVGTFSHEQLEAGVPFTSPVAQKKADELRELVVKKNELYFHRYRPQNETYLFLFRKHEQGNNAVEIPQFDPLVEEVDQTLHRSNQPAQYKVELKLTSS